METAAPDRQRRAFTVPNRSAAASSQQLADDLFRQCREGGTRVDLELTDEDLRGLSAILKQPVAELKEICR